MLTQGVLERGTMRLLWELGWMQSFNIHHLLILDCKHYQLHVFNVYWTLTKCFFSLLSCLRFNTYYSASLKPGSNVPGDVGRASMEHACDE